ncbi:MAG: hypothetical protein NTW16_00175 [Bacteroidetes bacterium]|nr:hypothetical protein [Bacteroidota bacterium]
MANKKTGKNRRVYPTYLSEEAINIHKRLKDIGIGYNIYIENFIETEGKKLLDESTKK